MKESSRGFRLIFRVSPGTSGLNHVARLGFTISLANEPVLLTTWQSNKSTSPSQKTSKSSHQISSTVGIVAKVQLSNCRRASTPNMYSYRGRGGPSRSTPANVTCQKCLKKDMLPWCFDGF
ncbi:hypothetical protein BR93DRAFT_814732 [Coniochaeta sp. PMI_546]|nr:hypothetical protein BR93DRAFT_814732 [Coniochaeta sp. PMI_546]